MASKRQNGVWLCLPRKEFATRGYAITKVLLLLFFLAVFVCEVAWTVIMIRHYRKKVADTKAATLWPSRSELQVYNTHSHFFLFTGLLSSSVIAIGFWGILMEYLVVLAAFSWMVGVMIAFEVIGAWQSDDAQVQLFKAYGVAPEPLLMIFGLVFAHMIRVCERKLAESPMYKKRQAEMRSKGETGTSHNVVKKRSSIESDELDNDPANNNTMASANQQPATINHQPHSLRGGIDNVGLTMEDEVGPMTTDPGVRGRPGQPVAKDESINIDVREGS